MEKDQINIETTFPVSPETFYQDWLNSVSHTNFTGGEAKIKDEINSSFTAWNGYISGKN